MGSSFIEYRGHGFWSADRFIERLAQETADALVAHNDEKEGWRADLAAHWKLQHLFGGWVHLKLDDFLTDAKRREEIREVVRGVTDDHAVDDPIHQTGILLLQLLDGDLTTDAASPLDYMVGTPNRRDLDFRRPTTNR